MDLTDDALLEVWARDGSPETLEEFAARLEAPQLTIGAPPGDSLLVLIGSSLAFLLGGPLGGGVGSTLGRPV